MSLRDRLERGPERRIRQVECSELRRRTDMVAIPIHAERDDRPEWLRRGHLAKDQTGAIR